MVRIVILLGLLFFLTACQHTNDLSKIPNPNYCHHVQAVDYNLYEVLNLGVSGDLSDMVISHTPLLRRNAFKSVELVDDYLIDGNINLAIHIKDDGIRKLQPATQLIAIVVDGKKVQFFNVYNQLDNEMELSFANNDLTLATFEKLKFVNCQSQ